MKWSYFDLAKPTAHKRSLVDSCRIYSVDFYSYSVQCYRERDEQRERERGVHRIEEQLYNSALSQCYSVS